MASAEKRPNGKWRVRWREYPAGPQKTKQFDLKKHADAHLITVQHQLATGTYIDPAKGRTTVAEFYALWAARQPWRGSSREAVTSMFSTHILPAFGDRPLSSIRRGDVEAWAAGLPLAATTAGRAVQNLATLLEAAVGDGLVATNVVRGAKRPKVEAEPVKPLTAAELDRLTEAAPDWFRVAITLGAAVGLRQGEATGLGVEAVDFMRQTVTVERQLVTPAKGDPSFGPLKTKRSYRTVPLAGFAVADLARHVEHHGTGDGGVVLHDRGEPVRRQRFGDYWRGIRARAGLPGVRYHDLRHTYASVLLSGGVSVPAAADYLGHSPAVLLRTYAHMVPADHDRARSVVEAAFAHPTEDFLRTAGPS